MVLFFAKAAGAREGGNEDEGRTIAEGTTWAKSAYRVEYRQLYQQMHVPMLQETKTSTLIVLQHE